MKKLLLKIVFYIIYIFTYFFSTILLIKPYNNSIQASFILVFAFLIIILSIGFLFTKIIFNFSIENKRIKKINIKNFNKQNIKSSIISSILSLLIYFIILYFIFYYFSDIIFSKITFSTGIINSFKYIVKIYFISLPLYAFELTFIEYCTFFNSITIEFILKILKYLFYIIIALILTTYFNFNGFLYTKLAIDILFLPYYIIKIREIIKLCGKQFTRKEPL